MINQLGNASSCGYQEFVKDWEVTNLPSAMTENELYWQKDKEAFEVFKAKRMTWKELEKQVKEI